MKTQVNLKIDNDVKTQAQARAKELGLSLSSVVNVTLKRFAKTGEIEITTSHKMTPYLEEIVREAREEYKAGKTKSFSNVDDLMKHLNS